MEANRSITLLSSIFLILGLGLYTYAISNTEQVTNIDADQAFGLIEQINPLFLPSIILIVISLLLQVRLPYRKLYLLSLAALGVVLWGTPVILETYPRNWDTYHFGFLTQIVVDRGLDFSLSAESLTQYIEYPGSFVYFAFLRFVTGLDLLALFGILSVLVVPLILLSFYALFRRITDRDDVARLSILIFLLVTTVLYTSPSPQSLMLVSFPLFLMLVLKPTQSSSASVLLVLLLIGIVISHPTTGILIVFILVSISVAHLISRRNLAKALRPLLRVLIVTSVLFAAWFAFVAWASGTWLVGQFVLHLGEILRTEPVIEGISQGTILFPQQIRAATFFAGAIVAVGYTLSSWYNRGPFHAYFALLGASMLFAFFDYGLIGGFFTERTMIVGYMAIAPVLANIILRGRAKPMGIVGAPDGQATLQATPRSSSRVPVTLFLVLVLLVPTSTIYMYEARAFYSQSIVDGWRFAISARGNGSYSLDISRNPLKIFLVLEPQLASEIFAQNSKRVYLVDVLREMQAGEPPELPCLIVFSDKAKNGAIRSGWSSAYASLEETVNRDAGFQRIFQTTSMEIYLAEGSCR